MSPRLPSLPIDPLLPEIAGRLAAGPALVLVAPPGAGKTTRVPPAVLSLWPDGEVLVLEPRRLAASLSACRVAEERGEALGETVGVQMRFESVGGPRTRLRFLTEGVLLRRLQEDPQLRGVRAVFLDEFHERHLQADLALALLLRLQRGPRPDLRLCVMSATLQHLRVAEFLGGPEPVPVIESQGRSHEVTIEYADDLLELPLPRRVRAAVLRVLTTSGAEGDGDILVFLPGGAEIRAARAALDEVAGPRDLQVLPLYGDLPLSEQRRALLPRDKGRKVILSTNVAETSVTIPGVTAVIDSGLSRIAGHSPWSGLPSLRVQKICQASAAQRAGRAGRLRPGRCVRLYSRHDHDARPRHEVAELQRLDLAETVLLLRSGGLDARAIEWLEPPREPALAAAETLLSRLGALGEAGQVTELGRRMARLPAHPRLSRLLLCARERGVAEDACVVAALLSERELRSSGPQQRAQEHGPSDLLHLLDLFKEARQRKVAGVEPGVVAAVDRAQRQLGRLLRQLPGAAGAPPRGPEDADEALLFAILAGYPDRVARRRAGIDKGIGREKRDVELIPAAGGSTAVLSPRSVAQEEELLVLVDAEQQEGKVVVRLASAIRPDWLLDLPGAAITESTTCLWHAAGERVEVVERLLYEKLVLSESRRRGDADGTDPAVWQVLLGKAREAGPRAFGCDEQMERLLQRLRFLRDFCPDAGFAGPETVDEAFAQGLAELCPGCASFAALREVSFLDALRGRLGLQGVQGLARRTLLDRLAPEQLALPSGRRARIEYPPGQAPFVASRMQDFFGFAGKEAPRVGGGKVPLVLHLLAPNGRPVQVTTDLPGFFQRHYPALRKELSRRYPRHFWPADPATKS